MGASLPEYVYTAASVDDADVAMEIRGVYSTENLARMAAMNLFHIHDMSGLIPQGKTRHYVVDKHEVDTGMVVWEKKLFSAKNTKEGLVVT